MSTPFLPRKLTIGRLFVILGLFVICSLVTQIMGNAKALAAYNGARIIDDSVFLNANSMSVAQIQTFLSDRGAGLANMNFTLNCYGQDSKERQWYTAVGAPCDQSIPASHIIYYAAQIYGVNPQVILATMQKEQSLTTAPNPTSWQLNQAMGYACPTSGQCGGNSTFPYQIDSGTWVLRYHYERARGNSTWWNNNASWTCGTEKNYYKPNLYPGQDVRFYDQNGVHYRTYHIYNAATSSFYCYTPHAYNNPQGLYGREAYGTTGMYYSGSYNFVYFFELWFGSTIGPEFAAQVHSKSPYFIINSGESKTVYIEYKNIGRAFWKDDSSTFPGYYPIRIATTGPINRGSNFYANNWLSPSRATGSFTKVFESDGITLSPEQHTVQPGQIARFEFTIYASPLVSGGVYGERFQPILEGAPGWSWNIGAETTMEIGVHKPIFAATLHSQNTTPNIISPEFSSDAYLQFKNTGNEPWYDDVSVPNGKYPVHLATTAPINRGSKFADSWPSAGRPNLTFTKVYEANGSTLAANQHVVLPGQIARFEFSLKNNGNVTPGFHAEHFQPILEGAPGWSWNMEGSALVNVGIPSPETKASYHTQSTYPTLTSGQSTVAYIQFRNAGNTKWYDDVSVPNGKYPVHLATTAPINRGSKFADSWPSAGRPNLTFTKVYEANGSTLAANQHVVLPGQIARFEFSLKNNGNVTPGFHAEHFQPILEGAPGWSWNMEGSAWLGITITH